MQPNQLSLSADLKIDYLASELKSNKRIRIENVLTAHSADAILNCLKHKIAWHLAYSDAEARPIQLDEEALNRMSAEDHEQVRTELYARAADQYQYMYKFYPIINAILQGKVAESSMLYQIASFLNGTEFIKFARQLTGNNTIVKLNPTATLYEPGHFLSMHDDFGDHRESADNGQRLYAVVFGFSENWSNDWGGGTNFYDSAEAFSAQTWYPGFNTMTVFDVPALHSVSPVAPFAKDPRYSITGWLRSDPNIDRPDLA